MKNLVLLQPRLDLSFKKGAYHEKEENWYDKLPEIRKHWYDFFKLIYKFSDDNNVNLTVDERPLWEFTPDLYKNYKDCIFLIPHKNIYNFQIPNNKCLYYMQTVIPNFFSIDEVGWGPLTRLFKECEDDYYFFIRSSKKFYTDELNSLFRKLQVRTKNNISKFYQPPKKIDDNNYFLFTCQIPHDETIKFHSNVSVFDALKLCLDTTKYMNENIIVKGHPINENSMIELENLTKKYDNAKWVGSNYSIHSLIENSKCVLTVNSGTGIEAILHNKPVIAFGTSEYEPLTVNKNFKPDNVEDLFNILAEMNYDVNKNHYEWYINRLFNFYYDSNDYNTFYKLKNKLL